MITEVLGFNQSYQWYTGKTFGQVPDPTFIKQKLFLSNYNIPNLQARFTFGFKADLTNWKDSEFIGYEGETLIHNILKDRKEVSRLIFNVSGDTRSINDWKDDLIKVTEILLWKYPNLNELYFEPVIGCNINNTNIRTAKNHPNIEAAIYSLKKKSSIKQIKAGAICKIDIEDFSDNIGHLTSIGAKKANEYIFKFYDIKL